MNVARGCTTRNVPVDFAPFPRGYETRENVEENDENGGERRKYGGKKMRFERRESVAAWLTRSAPADSLLPGMRGVTAKETAAERIIRHGECAMLLPGVLEQN